MGTYTTNYQLYMPTIGETGWGTLVNENFTTIDSTMKGLSNRITAVENEVNGALSCTTVTTSGKITGNGGIVGTTGTFSGAVQGAKIKQTSPYTVNAGSVPSAAGGGEYGSDMYLYFYLPFNPAKYTGTITVKSYGNYVLYYKIGLNGSCIKRVFGSGDAFNITFTNAEQIMIWTAVTSALPKLVISNLTFS